MTKFPAGDWRQPFFSLSNFFNESYPIPTFTTDTFSGLFKTGFETIGNSAIDISEESDKFVMSVPVPGFTKEEVEVELFDNMLSIGAVKKENRGKKMKKSLAYSYTLGADIDVDNITCECENGLLTIDLPRYNRDLTARPIKIEVK